jgi:hypothetical protein
MFLRRALLVASCLVALPAEARTFDGAGLAGDTGVSVSVAFRHEAQVLCFALHVLCSPLKRFTLFGPDDPERSFRAEFPKGRVPIQSLQLMYLTDRLIDRALAKAETVTTPLRKEDEPFWYLCFDWKSFRAQCAKSPGPDCKVSFVQGRGDGSAEDGNLAVRGLSFPKALVNQKPDMHASAEDQTKTLQQCRDQLQADRDARFRKKLEALNPPKSLPAAEPEPRRPAPPPARKPPSPPPEPGCPDISLKEAAIVESKPGQYWNYTLHVLLRNPDDKRLNVEIAWDRYDITTRETTRVTETVFVADTGREQVKDIGTITSPVRLQYQDRNFRISRCWRSY